MMRCFQIKSQNYFGTHYDFFSINNYEEENLHVV